MRCSCSSNITWHLSAATIRISEHWKYYVEHNHIIFYVDWFWVGIYTDIPPSLRSCWFDIGYIKYLMWWWRWYNSGEMSALSTSSVYVYNGRQAWYDVGPIVKPTYHSSVEWLIADVTVVSTLQVCTSCLYFTLEWSCGLYVKQRAQDIHCTYR